MSSNAISTRSEFTHWDLDYIVSKPHILKRTLLRCSHLHYRHFNQTLAKRAVPYSSEALRQDLQRVSTAWEDGQSSRDRNAIYAYL